MIYIIGGASRSGKTTIAQHIAKEKGIPYLSLDWLVMGFTNGMPECGIHDLLMPDDIAQRIWDFLRAMCESMLWAGDDCIIEGEAVLPELILKLKKTYPDDLKICFLGYANADINKKTEEIKAFARSDEKDWLNDKSDTYIKNHVKNMIAFSKTISVSCIKYHLVYFDVSKDLNKGVEAVRKYLVNL